MSDESNNMGSDHDTSVSYRPKLIRPFLVTGRPNYHIEYWCGEKKCRKSLGTDSYLEAVRRATELLEKLPVKPTRSASEKAATDPDIYIYYRKPYLVKIGSVVIGECLTRKEARRVRDNHLEITQ